MGKVILIAGLGVMGANYSRNLIALAKDLDLEDIIAADVNLAACEKIRAEFPELLVYHINPEADAIEIPDGLAPGITPDLKSLVEFEKPCGFIGATQTDSHVNVLGEVLSAIDDKTKMPFIQSVLQEKPYGLFDGEFGQRAAIEALINEHGITFNLDSILMFSGIWGYFEQELEVLDKAGYKHGTSTCTYGKNRFNDPRPAHEGIFGTEATHAIDIARRQGHKVHSVKAEQAGIKAGYFNVANPQLAYYCKAGLTNEFNVPLAVEMAINLDRPVRRVVHRYEKVGNPDDFVEVEINFDIKNGKDEKVDRLDVRDADGNLKMRYEVAAGVKMAEALRTAFSEDAKSVYGLEDTGALRQVMEDIRAKAEYTDAAAEILCIE